MDALELVVEDGECPMGRVSGMSGVYPIIWPPGSERTADGQGIVGPQGEIVTFGEQIEVGGGIVAPPAFTPSRCQADEVIVLDLGMG